jgi:hypothetical protein
MGISWWHGQEWGVTRDELPFQSILAEEELAKHVSFAVVQNNWQSLVMRPGFHVTYLVIR